MLIIASDLADVLIVEDVCGEDDGEAEREEDDHEDLERGGLGGGLHLAGDCALNTVQYSTVHSTVQYSTQYSLSWPPRLSASK